MNYYIRGNHESVKVFQRRQFRGFDGGSVSVKTLSVVRSIKAYREPCKQVTSMEISRIREINEETLLNERN